MTTMKTLLNAPRTRQAQTNLGAGRQNRFYPLATRTERLSRPERRALLYAISEVGLTDRAVATIARSRFRRALYRHWHLLPLRDLKTLLLLVKQSRAVPAATPAPDPEPGAVVEYHLKASPFSNPQQQYLFP